MAKNLLLSLVLTAFSTVAFAAELAPAVQYSRDANYIYIKEAVRLTLDSEQQTALKQAIVLISAQLEQVNTLRQNDPNGDLKGISDSIEAMNKKVDMLVEVSAKLYGEVVPFGIKAFQAVPSAVMIFAGVSADKNILKFFSVGGSGTAAYVLVPMKVTRISISNPKDVQTGITFSDNSAIVLMGLGLGAAQASVAQTVGAGDATPVNKNGRGGIGFIWGDLNKASDIAGAAYGGSATIDLGVAGLNIKALGVKNLNKPGALNNFIVMLGLQKQAPLSGKIPFTDIGAEFGGNAGAIIDAGATLASTKDLGASIAGLISGKN